MKLFLLMFSLLVLLLVAGLMAATGIGSARPEVGPGQVTTVQGAATQPETMAVVETQPEAAEPAVAQPETVAEETLPSAPAEAQPEAAAQVFETQSNSEKAVTVQVTPLNLSGGGSTLDFEVAFNTHSVDLNFDPAAISALRDDQGREYPAAGWEGSEPGGHHRSGLLQFTAPENTPTFVEVVIRDVAGVPERVFRWKLNS